MDKVMRIGMVVINSAIGGTEKRFSNLFRFLPGKTGGDYHFFVPEILFQKMVACDLMDLTEHGITRLYQNGIKSVYPLNPKQWGVLKVRGLAKLIKPFWRTELRQSIARIQPDVIHVALPTDHLRPLPQKPLLIELANNTGGDLNTWLIRHAVKRKCIFNCATEGIRSMLIQAFPDDAVESRARIIPCSFIDYSKVQFHSEKPRQKKIVFIGRLEESKKPFVFLRVIELLSKRRQDFQAQILGTGSLEISMRKWIVEHHLTNMIHMTYVANPLEILSLVYFSAYQVDNYHSQALMEAMASGCAIVASDIGQTRKVVDESCGFLTANDPEEMALRIDFLLENMEIAKEMGVRARQKVMREQTFERYATHLSGLYRESYELWYNHRPDRSELIIDKS
jgi:glycosyltransferase involved in cell wall biosynthesis